MKYLSIKRKDGSISTVRYECESVTEKSLTYEEEIIKELYYKIAELEQELKDEKENHTHFKKCWLEEFKLRHELEQQVEELKKVPISSVVRRNAEGD